MSPTWIGYEQLVWTTTVATIAPDPSSSVNVELAGSSPSEEETCVLGRTPPKVHQSARVLRGTSSRAERVKMMSKSLYAEFIPRGQAVHCRRK